MKLHSSLQRLIMSLYPQRGFSVLRTGDRWKIQIEIGLMFVLTPLALQIGMQGLLCNSQWNKMIVFLLLCLSTWSDIVCSSHKFYCISVQFSVVLSINLWHGLVLQRCQSLLNIQSKCWGSEKAPHDNWCFWHHMCDCRATCPSILTQDTEPLTAQDAVSSVHEHMHTVYETGGCNLRP